MTEPDDDDSWLEYDVRIPEEEDELIAWLARKRRLPDRAPQWSDLEYILAVPGQDLAIDDEPAKEILQRLGVTSDSACEQVRERIMNHPEW